MPLGTTFKVTDKETVNEYIKRLTDPVNPLRHENYAAECKHAKEMRVHIYGEQPDALLKDYRPNEPKDIHDYRLKIFQPITKAKAKKVVNVLSRINNAKNYSLKWDETVSGLVRNETIGDESLETYVTNEYPYFGSLIQWIFDIVLKQDLADPNAVICFKPAPMEYEETDYLDPFGYIYPSENKVDLNPDEYYTIKLNEKSLVKVNNSLVRDGDMYDIYTRNEIIRVMQVGEKSKNKFTWKVIFTHNAGEVPVVILGGEYVQNTYPPMYESYMSGVLPFWNDALREFSDKQATFVQHIYLERVEVQVECDNEMCGSGNLPDGTPVTKGYICSGEKMVACGRCSGSGRITGRGPYGVTTVKKDDLAGDEPIFPGVQYISKPTEIVELLTKDIEKLILDGYEAINMDAILGNKAAQSGEAKMTDRTELDGFLTLISNNIFDNILYYSIRYINVIRYGEVLGAKELTKQLPVINKPTSFDVLSVSRMIDDFSNRTTLPQELKDQLMLDIFDKLFSNDAMKRKYNRAIVELDPLRGKTPDEKFTAFSNSAITEEDYKISENIKLLLLKAVGDNDKFLDLDRLEQYDMLKKMVSRPEKPEGVPDAPDALDPVAQETLQAQANLKGTVGGVQGILAIQASVAQGITQRDAGIALLIQIYGFTEDTANELLGAPKKNAGSPD